ncbi:hypothetical protein TPA0909_28410 [Streptomyces albus]|nr:hypothetical protein TPA0909_28410 [Streptomyces albus]
MTACGGAFGRAPGPGDGFGAGPFEGLAVFPGGSVPSGPSPGVSGGSGLSRGGSVLTEPLPGVQGVFSGVSGIHAFECSVEVITETFPAPARSHRGGEGRNPQVAG